MLNTISYQEYSERYDDVIVNWDMYVDAFLENGDVLWNKDWNGEIYSNQETGKEYRPVYRQIDEDEFEVIGYEEVK
jgi:hypothetical protein